MRGHQSITVRTCFIIPIEFRTPEQATHLKEAAGGRFVRHSRHLRPSPCMPCCRALPTRTHANTPRASLGPSTHAAWLLVCKQRMGARCVCACACMIAHVCVRLCARTPSLLQLLCRPNCRITPTPACSHAPTHTSRSARAHVQPQRTRHRIGPAQRLQRGGGWRMEGLFEGTGVHRVRRMCQAARVPGEEGEVLAPLGARVRRG